MATHSRILAWGIPWTEEPGGLQSMGSHSWVPKPPSCYGYGFIQRWGCVTRILRTEHTNNDPGTRSRHIAHKLRGTLKVTSPSWTGESISPSHQALCVSHSSPPTLRSGNLPIGSCIRRWAVPGGVWAGAPGAAVACIQDSLGMDRHRPPRGPHPGPQSGRKQWPNRAFLPTSPSVHWMRVGRDSADTREPRTHHGKREGGEGRQNHVWTRLEPPCTCLQTSLQVQRKSIKNCKTAITEHYTPNTKFF